MTRLGRTPSRGRFDLAEAFRFLGKAPSHHELGLAADLLRKAGMEQLDYDDELVDLAESNGSMGIVALDLATAVGCGVEALHAAGPRRESRAQS